MNDLLEFNKQELFKQLNSLTKFNNMYRCNDIIELVSQSVARDKRLISDYNKEDEITCCKVPVDGVIRLCRFFTRKGLTRYIHDGKLYNYKNVCCYFEITPKNKSVKFIQRCVSSNNPLMFDKKKILKWLFSRRKATKRLPDQVSYAELSTWLKIHSDKPDKQRWNDFYDFCSSVCTRH